jgi:hypothetical protein
MEGQMGELQDAIDETVGPGWRRFLTVVAVLVAIYMASGLVFGLWPFSSAAGVVQKVTSAESIIGNYQWFYDQYNAIKAQEANVAAMPKDAPERAGMLMVLNNATAEYNSRSKQITRNLWKASDLPYQIELGGAK